MCQHFIYIDCKHDPKQNNGHLNLTNAENWLFSISLKITIIELG